MADNWLHWFKGSARSRELQDTHDLFSRASACRSGSPLYPDERRVEFMLDLVHEVCERRQITPTVPLGEAMWGTLYHLLHTEGFLVELPDSSSIEKLTLEEGVELRSNLRRHLRFVEDQKRLLTIWRDKLVYVFAGMLEYFPLSAFTDVDENGFAADDSIVLPEAKAFALCDNLPEALDRLLITFYDKDVMDARLFESLRERFDNNALVASGISPDRRNESRGKAKLPTENRDQSPKFLVDAYLQATPFYSFFQSPLPFAIPFPARFEHTHIVGGTGHGKTQLMQFLINHDLVRAGEDGRSVVVMDSQGDLYRAISRLRYFSSDEALADRLVLIDPTDVDYPVALNMFDFNRDRLSGFPRVDQEKILNATIELYEYFFGALLGAELTQRQGLIFKYLARLLMQIPDATIHTLRDIMENGEKYRPFMEELGGSPRAFFLTRFFDRQFNETKKQILTRLWGVLANASLERMFSHPRNKVDIFSLLNEGKIILINTAKDLLGQEGAAIFGRFFIALIAQAAVQRAAIPAHERRPAFVYIDEAQDYFDDNISNLLNQARKYRIGLIFAHQNLDQLGAGLRSSVLASTSIKFAGGVSAKDARVLDSELRCEAEFLMTQKKERTHTEFACHVRNYTGRALSVRIPLGHVDSLPKLTHDDWEYLLEDNRGRYSAPPMLPAPDEPDEPPEPPAKPSSGGARPRPVPVPREEVPEVRANEPEPARPPTQGPRQPKEIARSAVPATTERKTTAPNRAKTPKETPELGRGGRQHKYIQHLIKQLGEERGFRATVEESILDGAGSVDVALVRGRDRIAFEISITTRNDQELGNIEKCIAAGYKAIVLVGASEKHVKTLSKFIEENLEEKDQGKVQYVTPEALPDYLDSFGPPPSEQTVRGYKVRTVQSVLDPEDAQARRKALAEVIARSLKKSKEG